jgi:5-methylcytosine-specific restriction endonuclease McrA
MESEESKVAKLHARLSWKKELADKRARGRITPKRVLLRQASLKGINWAKLKAQVLLRDLYTCQYCGAQEGPDIWDKMQVDHKIPVVLGGKTVRSNLQAACIRCNYSKNDTPLRDWGRVKNIRQRCVKSELQVSQVVI